MSNLSKIGVFAPTFFTRSNADDYVKCLGGDFVRQCIEEIFLVNFTVDFLALASALRSVRLIKPTRLFSAAFIGGAAGCLSALSPVPRVFGLIFAAVIAPLLIFTACSSVNPRICVRFIFASTLIAGMRAAIPDIPAMLCAAAIFALSVFKSHAALGGDWSARLTIENGGRVAVFDALIDTGNRLHEPLSGLPVMIVESALIEELMPSDFDPFAPLDNLPRGFRAVSYGGVGGQGVMGAFMPEKTIIMRQGRRLRAPDIWVCAYPGRLPGKTRALLPPTAIK